MKKVATRVNRRKTIKRASRKCTFCGKGGKGVTLAPDPYQEDVNHDYTRVWMHDECRTIVVQDV